MGVTIPSAAGEVLEQYEVSNSLRLNRADSAYLTKASIGATTGSGKTFTFSAWVKRSGLGSEQYIIHARSADSQGNFARLEFDSGDAIRFRGYSTTYLDTNRVFRDPSAWYHIVLAVDTDTSGDGNSVRLYINGVEETSFATDNNPSTDDDLILGSDRAHYLGASYYGNSVGAAFDGYMAEVHLVDGQQLTPSYFGKFDTNAVWIPKRYTGTFGGNGFKFEFKQTGTSANSSGIGADTSGNDSHFTPTNLGATDVTEDTCTNNFATLSSIDTHTTSPTLAEGNTDFTGIANTAFTPARSTIAVSQGKWYMEYKFKTAGGGVGVMTTQSPISDHLRDDADVRSIYRGWNGYYYGRNNSGAIDDVGGNSVTLSENDIVGVALDLDNGYVYFSKNGTYMNGQDGSTAGNPASNNGGSGGAANHPSQLLTNQHDGVWGFMAYDISTSTAGRVICNFGNIPSTVGSPNTDGKYGKFYYAPPSGFYALCTKRLAEFG